MFEPFQIKEEKSEFLDNAPVCTCESEVKVRSKARQVLVNFGLNRKKVFTLKGKNEKLYEQFKNHILSEPAFSELLNDSYVVFQQFSEKFGTWVDVDLNEKLEDGTVLNAVFFPNNIERDEFNPGCIKRKEILMVTENVKRKQSSDIIHIDLTDEIENSVKKSKYSKQGKFSKAGIEQNNGEESEEENLKKNERKVRSSLVNIDELKKEGEQEKEEGDLKNNEIKSEKSRSCNVNKDKMKKEEDNSKKNKEHKKKKTKILPEVNDKKTDDSNSKNIESRDKKDDCVKKNKSSMKTNVIVAEEGSQNTDESKSKNLQKTPDPKKQWYQEVANHSTRKRELTSPQQNIHHEMPIGRNCHYPETNDNFQASKKEWKRRNENESARNLVENRDSFVSEIYNICFQRDWPAPVFVTKEDPLNGFSCELKVKNTTYYKVHSDSSKVEEAVAELAFNRLKEENYSNTYNTKYWESWERYPRRPSKRSPRRPFQRSYRKSWKNV